MEHEGILLIQNLIFLSFPHPTCTIIPQMILVTSFLVNTNFKKELRFQESFRQSGLVTYRANLKISTGLKSPFLYVETRAPGAL